MANVTWKRASDEALDEKMLLLMSSRAKAALRRHAGVLGVSASELARQLIDDGLERLDRPDESAEVGQVYLLRASDADR